MFKLLYNETFLGSQNAGLINIYDYTHKEGIVHKKDKIKVYINIDSYARQSSAYVCMFVNGEWKRLGDIHYYNLTPSSKIHIGMDLLSTRELKVAINNKLKTNVDKLLKLAEIILSEQE